MASILTGGFRFQEILIAFRLSRMRLLSRLNIKSVIIFIFFRKTDFTCMSVRRVCVMLLRASVKASIFAPRVSI